MRTQVGIIGAGPAGLTLSRMLHLHGIESVIIEKHSRNYIEQRIRAGVLESGTTELLNSIGAGERMMREGMLHHGIELRFDGKAHRVDFNELTGKSILVYGQQEIIKDLVAAHLTESRPILFESTDVSISNIDTKSPRVRFLHNGEYHHLDCDYIAGCDGFHGAARQSIPPATLKLFEHKYPFAWFGILAEAAPSTSELVYATHESGFALHSMRSPKLVRNYFQCAPDENVDNWSDDRIWNELNQRMALTGGFRLNEGKIIDKSVTPLRSFIVEPMQYGRLYLAGDAAHIVPPTGAKGMNLALKDVAVLADALFASYTSGNTEKLQGYSGMCLKHVWKAQSFSAWMTSMLHRFDTHDDFQRKLQLAQLGIIAESKAGARYLAEGYIGI